MPFVKVWGVPFHVNDDRLLLLRQDIVSSIHLTMSTLEVPVPKNWVRPFFPLDRLDMPKEPNEGAQTIYVELDTAMFNRPLDPEDETLPLAVMEHLAQTVWDAFDGVYEVEACLVHLDAAAKKLIKAAKT